jgi:hypothetical protein
MGAASTDRTDYKAYMNHVTVRANDLWTARRFGSSLIVDMMLYRTLLIMLLAYDAAFAQLESAIITGATAPAAVKAGKTAAKGISSTMSGAGNALGAAGRGSSSSAPARTATGNARVASAAVVNTNVSEAKSDFKSDDIQVGMTRDELMAVAGKPYTKITIPIEGGSSERLTYQMKDGGSLRIVLELEKVAEIKPLETAR